MLHVWLNWHRTSENDIKKNLNSKGQTQRKRFCVHILSILVFLLLFKQRLIDSNSWNKTFMTWIIDIIDDIV